MKGNHGFQYGHQLLDKLEPIVNLDTEGVTVGDEVRVFGVNHYSGGEIPWEVLTFPNSVAESVSILVLHQTLEQLTGTRNDCVDVGRFQQQFNGQFDRIVSGHHHDAVVQDWNGIPIMYTGAAERMSKNKDPTDRVVWLLTVVSANISYEQYQVP